MYVHRNLWSYCVSASVCNCSTSGSHICMCCIEYLHHVQTKFCAEPDSLLLNVTRISNLSLTGWLQQVDCKGFLTGYCLFLSWQKNYSWLQNVPGICLQCLPSNRIFVVAGCIHFLDAPPSQHSPTNFLVAFASLLSYWVIAARPHRSKLSVMISRQMNKQSTWTKPKQLGVGEDIRAWWDWLPGVSQNDRRTLLWFWSLFLADWSLFLNLLPELVPDFSWNCFLADRAP